MIRALLAAPAIATATIGAASLAGAAPTPSPGPPPGPPYADCAAAIAAGKANIPIGDPAYKPEWDHDGDGFACESSDDSE